MRVLNGAGPAAAIFHSDFRCESSHRFFTAIFPTDLFSMAAKQALPAPTLAQKLARAYWPALMLLVAMVLACAAIDHLLAAKQKALLQITTATLRQAALIQSIGALVEQHQATHDDSVLPNISQATATLLVDFEAVEQQFLPALQHGYMDDAANLSAHDLDGKVRGFIDKASGYAQTPSAEDAAGVIKLAGQDIPLLWTPSVDALVTAREAETAKLGIALLALTGAMLGTLAFVSFGVLRPALAEITRQKEHLEHMGSTDPLTGLYNRSMFFRVVTMLISGAVRHKHKLSALAVDLDALKHINDMHGRAAGDAAIRALAAALGDTLRDSDVMGRLGGGEFGVFLPSTDEYRAAFVAEKLRVTAENLPFSVKGSENILLRISIGVAELQPHHKTPDDVLRPAVAALRAAKDKGRNCVITFSALAAEREAAADAADAAGAAGAAQT
jgi:diguanylate cyclase (GGDEF)-like protein